MHICIIYTHTYTCATTIMQLHDCVRIIQIQNPWSWIQILQAYVVLAIQPLVGHVEDLTTARIHVYVSLRPGNRASDPNVSILRSWTSSRLLSRQLMTPPLPLKSLFWASWNMLYLHCLHWWLLPYAWVQVQAACVSTMTIHISVNIAMSTSNIILTMTRIITQHAFTLHKDVNGPFPVVRLALVWIYEIHP